MAGALPLRPSSSRHGINVGGGQAGPVTSPLMGISAAACEPPCDGDSATSAETERDGLVQVPDVGDYSTVKLACIPLAKWLNDVPGSISISPGSSTTLQRSTELPGSRSRESSSLSPVATSSTSPSRLSSPKAS